MDNRIYERAGEDYGVYVTRRFPKSRVPGGSAGTDENGNYAPPDNPTFAAPRTTAYDRKQFTKELIVHLGGNVGGGNPLLWQVPETEQWWIHSIAASLLLRPFQSYQFNVDWIPFEPREFPRTDFVAVMPTKILRGYPLLVGPYNLTTEGEFRFSQHFSNTHLQANTVPFTGSNINLISESGGMGGPVLVPSLAEIVCLITGGGWAINGNPENFPNVVEFTAEVSVEYLLSESE